MLIEHRRYLYSYGVAPRIAVISKGSDLLAFLESALGESWYKEYDTVDAAFEATFKHGSKFIRWVDPEWQEIEA